MEKLFERTEVAGVSLPRILIGTNWLLGWSHKSIPMDEMIKEKFNTREKFFPIFEAYSEYGIDAIMAPASQQPLLLDAIDYFRDKTGKDIIIIDTPIINTYDSDTARAEAEASFKNSAKCGATFCLIHHSSAEELVNKSKRTIERIEDYTSMIRDAGIIPGLSAHMPEMILYSDANGYDVETYIQLYNCLGFLMQIEVETIASIINNAKKPVMTIKSMAAGRCTPYVGLNFVWNTIRKKDMVTIGCMSSDEVHEDVEISFAALERRFPNMEKRSSPNQNQSVMA
jgi:hypothetical protein